MIKPEDGISLGVSGPSLRASGVNWDIRKSQPYSGYEKYDFNVPLGQHGDVYDRFYVRILELRESIKKNHPAGDEEHSRRAVPFD